MKGFVNSCLDHTKLSIRFQPWNCWGLCSEIDVGPPLFTLLRPEMPTDGVWTGWCDQPLSQSHYPNPLSIWPLLLSLTLNFPSNPFFVWWWEILQIIDPTQRSPSSFIHDQRNHKHQDNVDIYPQTHELCYLEVIRLRIIMSKWKVVMVLASAIIESLKTSSFGKESRPSIDNS
jgi:hypothetical protein